MKFCPISRWLSPSSQKTPPSNPVLENKVQNLEYKAQDLADRVQVLEDKARPLTSKEESSLTNTAWNASACALSLGVTIAMARWARCKSPFYPESKEVLGNMSKDFSLHMKGVLREGMSRAENFFGTIFAPNLVQPQKQLPIYSQIRFNPFHPAIFPSFLTREIVSKDLYWEDSKTEWLLKTLPIPKPMEPKQETLLLNLPAVELEQRQDVQSKEPSCEKKSQEDAKPPLVTPEKFSAPVKTQATPTTLEKSKKVVKKTRPKPKVTEADLKATKIFDLLLKQAPSLKKKKDLASWKKTLRLYEKNPELSLNIRKTAKSFKAIVTAKQRGEYPLKQFEQALQKSLHRSK